MIILILLLAYYAGNFLLQNNIKEVEDLNNNEQIAKYIEQLDMEIQEESKKTRNFFGFDFFNIFRTKSSEDSYSPELYKDALRIFENSELYNFENGWTDKCTYADLYSGFQKTSRDSHVNIDCGVVIDNSWNYDAFESVMGWSFEETYQKLSRYNDGYQIFSECTYGELQEVFDYIVEKTKKQVLYECKDLELNENQIGALTTVKYLYGNLGNFVEAYKLYGDSEALRDNFYIFDGGKFYFPLSSTKNLAIYRTRSESTWNMFNGNYNISGYHVEGGRIVLNSY